MRKLIAFPIVLVTLLACVGCGSGPNELGVAAESSAASSVMEHPPETSTRTSESVASTPQSTIAGPSTSQAMPRDPKDLPTVDHFENQNRPDSSMGKACWSFTEFLHMASSFAVPIVDGKPLYTNEFIDDSKRRNAVLGLLRQLIDLQDHVVESLPQGAQELVSFLIAKQRTLEDTVAKRGDVQSIRDYHDLFLATLGDSEGWPGLRSFISVTRDNSDCHLESVT